MLTSYPGTTGGQTSCTIGGNLTVSNTLEVTLSGTTSVGGYVSMSSGSVTTQEFLFEDGKVGKSLTATAGAGGLALEIGTGTGAAVNIAGSVTAKTGVGQSTSAFPYNDFTFASGSTIGGDVSLTSAGGADSFSIGASLNGSLAVNAGDGANTFALTGNVGGSVSLIEGNGADGATTFSGSVSGNLTITQGNGANATGGVTVTGSVAGLLKYTGGNGTDALSITPAAAAFYDIAVCFGTNTAASAYTLTLNANDTISGSIKGKGGNNTFTQGSAILLPTLVFINFP